MFKNEFCFSLECDTHSLKNSRLKGMPQRALANHEIIMEIIMFSVFKMESHFIEIKNQVFKYFVHGTELDANIQHMQLNQILSDGNNNENSNHNIDIGHSNT